eukprot:CAMPEP_0174288360 /NCGR_PEP_ID=MMETSP0809-20121228/20247_1 /TAXON_ID=73025 ORGANISM="Eutreptiella gymnastica-like, Strain CCMP1594" /NCGR_SAMPLE_ID=MMETSP0809 /ASSEMBLY_ACC=CAM_ASM_000658 /LENGTH=42 /DNA_ID= /DNA_START= /DNA_END= /DNA_ORIENTATION=
MGQWEGSGDSLLSSPSPPQSACGCAPGTHMPPPAAAIADALL